uniref:Putative secreted protein n=1 Tax=Anopheles darlingi TaxID=43151 RepID=A0A2M4DFU3_ANODA
MTTGWTVVSVTVALVWHTEIQRVRPDWHTAQRGSDRGIIHEELISHHLKLLVATDTQVRRTHANDRTIGNVSEPLDNQTGTGHLRQPIIVRSLRPVIGIILVRQRKDRDLVTLTMQILHGRVVGVLVRDEVRTANLATVRVLTLTVEDVLVQVNVVHVDRTVKGDGDHLWYLLRFDVSGNASSVGRTEAIGQNTLRRIAIRSTVRIQLNGASIFIRFVLAVRLAVAEQFLVETLAITTREFTLGTDRFVCLQDWKNLSWLLFLVTRGDLRFPIASLFFNVERQSGRASDLLESRSSTPHYFTAVAIGGKAEVLVSGSVLAQLLNVYRVGIGVIVLTLYANFSRDRHY